MDVDKGISYRKPTDIAELAGEVLDIARNRLLVNLRYLDVALTYHVRAIYDGTISTDGSKLCYSPVFVLKTYKNSREDMIRTYLHTVMHCIFMHPFLSVRIPGNRFDGYDTTDDTQRRLWDLACDMAVESVICELDLPCTRTDRTAKQQDVLNKIRRETGFLTAEKLFRAFADRAFSPGQSEASDRTGDGADIGESDNPAGSGGSPLYLMQYPLSELEQLFASDDHSAWYEASNDALRDSKSAADRYPSDAVRLPADDNEVRSDWKRIAEQVEMEIEAFAKVKGKYASSLVQNLRAVNRERYDYSAFLRKFAAVNETVRVSEDEFDYIYYNYGLQHYRNMPLIEPLEYREDSRIRDFVIAVDTSGSVAGAEVQTFLQKTYNILKSIESFHNRINFHIIQCDAKIQSDTLITCEADLDLYMQTMEIRGLGGTDFRPVFEYVDSLIASGDLSDLKGLIYFTDGLGTYPASKPAYRTAFVFIEKGYNVPEVPVWAMKVILQPEEI